ncbi:PQQ-binding-like beta-propeller repeat protein [Halospeciosus flavus]|uniref:outer membrane protein assembly factor BamB family protein n=1 Tax=Halospeciosus flavus TaxID=3032283 RepID=UPI003606FEA6
MVSRRSFLQAAGLAAVGSATALAGCSSSCPDSGAPTPSTVLTPDSTPVAADLGVTTDWPTFHHDAANTGYATDATPPSDPALSWRAAVPSDGRPSAPVVANGAVYVRDGVGGLHALDVTDGTERWTVETTRAPETWFAGGGSPTAHGGHVFVAGRDGVFAVDAADGTVAWSDSLAATDSAVVAGGSVFVPTDGALAAYDAATGERRWRVSDFDGPVSRPAVAAGTVFAVGSDLVALPARTGWSSGAGRSARRPPTWASRSSPTGRSSSAPTRGWSPTPRNRARSSGGSSAGRAGVHATGRDTRVALHRRATGRGAGRSVRARPGHG